MNYVVKSFFKGLAVFAPVAITVYIIYVFVTFVDGAVSVGIPGLGLVIAVATITGLGMLAGNVVGRRFFGRIEAMFVRVPIVKLVYGSIKDLLGAFVGDRKSFSKPVMLDVHGNGTLRVFGFVTCDTFADHNLDKHVAVYLPQSYNFAGNLIIAHRDRVTPVDADSAQFMAFIVSGGVAEMGAARTVYDDGPSPLQS
ncbi:MAG: DUF502 domain-containing protein [Myxococcales bacterium]|nr:DUF502 domain-containing protein [Myxococcales bacterium]